MGVASWGVASWGVASWVGGSGDFTDPNEWSNGTSPAPPPGAGDLAVYGTAGTVLFSGNTNVEADIQSAMTFDVSGGDYDLINTTEGLGGLQFKQGGALTITGPGEVDASVISAGPDLVAVTNMAVLSILADASNSAAMFGNSATLAISGGGRRGGRQRRWQRPCDRGLHLGCFAPGRDDWRWNADRRVARCRRWRGGRRLETGKSKVAKFSRLSSAPRGSRLFDRNQFAR